VNAVGEMSVEGSMSAAGAVEVAGTIVAPVHEGLVLPPPFP
jgi:hypothetical protein